MRKIIGICTTMLVAITCFAQEDLSVTERLNGKYGYAYYRDGFYEVGIGDGKCGICDSFGNEIIPNVYDRCRFETSCFVVEKGRRKSIFSKCGNKQVEIETSGAISIDIIKHYVEEKDKGCFIGILNSSDMKNAQLGLFDNKGEMLIPCEHKYIVPCLVGNGIFIIAQGGVHKDILGYFAYPFDAKYALYDIKTKKYITEFRYDYIDSTYGSEGLARFNVGGKITSTTNDYDAIVEGGRWGYLNEDGKEIISAKYTSATPFKDGVAQVTEKGVASLIANPLSGSTVFARTEQAIVIDTQIPETKKTNSDSFAFIFSNENYNNFSGADYSINDGKIFAEYCRKTLGMTENNVRYYEDATYGNMLKAIKQIQDIADVYEGDAKIIFYFSGLGMLDAKDGKKYMLPSDATESALSATAVSLAEIIDGLNKLNTKHVMIILDAPFNGMDKSGKALGAGRGVKISNRHTEEVTGNVILLMGGENGNGYSSKKNGHGLLTYSLLNQLKKSKGQISFDLLLETIIVDVKKESLDQFGEIQKPLIMTSEQLKGKLQTVKL